MKKLDKNIIYLSFDADSAGRKIGKAVLNDDPEEMSRVSDSISLGNKLFNKWAMDRGGICYSSGGDQGVYSIPKECTDELEQLRADYAYATGLTVSIGIGEHLSESGQALLLAKIQGKDQTVFFDKTSKKKIAQIKKRVRKGKFKSMEEYKIAESYLKKAESDGDPCPYCETSDNVDPDHCTWCHDAEIEPGAVTCPYCKGSQNDPSMGPKEPEIAEEDCAFCEDKAPTEQESCPYCSDADADAPGLGKPGITSKDPNTGIPSLVSPDSNNANVIPGSQDEKDAYESMDMNPPEIGKPSIHDHMPIGQNAPMDVVPKGDPDPNQRLDDQRDVEQGSVDGHDTKKELMGVDPEDNSSKDALMNIAEQIKDDGTPADSNVDAIDDADIGSGSVMEGNVSRPQGYVGQNTPTDMGEEGPNGMSETQVGDNVPDDGPDFGSLLEEGLDTHADSIQKDRAVQMVSQALVQFKGCKDVLEQNKAQMPQLYQASISMLKAMIEMAGVLKLSSATPQQDSNLGQEQEQLEPEVAQEEENEWHEPFPAHPDHGGEQKPGHAPKSTSQTNADGTGPDGPDSISQTNALDSKGKEGPKGSIGQPIGKLPSKNTTEHVAKTPMPIGAVNAKGQKKVMDDKGNIRFINMKQGLVQGPSGVPVKPEKR